MRILIALPFAATLLACAPEKSAEENAVSNMASSSGTDRNERKGVATTVQSEPIAFAYSYPREATLIPGLRAWLDGDRNTKRETFGIAASRDQALAKSNAFPFHQHSFSQKWQRVADTPRFLSLLSETASFSGGAHGNISFETLIWDRNRAKLLKPLDMFTSVEAFEQAVHDDFCAAVDRAKKQRGIAAPKDDGPFSDCPPASSQTIWLGSSDGRHLDRMTIAIAPYEIGPYAEGSYKINVPLTNMAVATVKPDFARDFLPTS